MQLLALGELVESVPIRREAEQIDGDDRLRLQLAFGAGLGNLLLEIRQVDIERVRLDVDKDRRCAGEQDDLGRRREREGRHEHRIPRTDAVSEQRHEDRVGSARAGDRVADAAILGELRFQACDRGAEDVSPVIENFLDRFGDLWLDDARTAPSSRRTGRLTSILPLPFVGAPLPSQVGGGHQ